MARWRRTARQTPAPTPPDFRITLHHDDATASATFAVTGELDLATASVLRDAATAALAERPNVLTLNLAGVSFCDAAGLGGLLDLREHAGAAGVRLRVAAVSPAVQRVLDATGTAPLFSLRLRPA